MNIFSKIIKTTFKHKFITGIILISVIVGGYFGYQNLTKKDDATQYVMAAVEKGTLVVSVSGSGQVLSLNQLDIKSKVSGDVIWLGIKAGQTVGQGQVIARLDESDIKKQIAAAEWNLKQQQISYNETVLNADRSLADAYDSGYSAVSTSFFSLSGYMQDLKNVLGTEQSSTEYVSAYRLILGSDSQFIKNLLADYWPALNSFNEKFIAFRQAYKDNDRATIYKLVSDTIDTAKLISQAIESARHMYDAIALEDYSSLNIASYIATMKPKINSDVSSVYSNINFLQKIKDSIDNANRNNPNTIEAAKNNLQNKEDILADLKNNLNDCAIVSPFVGVIAKLNIEKGDSISPSAVIVAIVTKQNIAEISLNEIDAAKVEAGQKATATFDAIDGLTLTGNVAEIDTLGAVSQGVVTYNAKIAFDTQDERVKPGMSVSVAIIVDMKNNVLLAPNSAIKQQSGVSYVQVAAPIPQNTANLSASAITDNDLRSQEVQTGLSNDTMTEIISGLQEGDSVVSRTIAPTTSNSSAQSSSTQRTSGFSLPGVSGGQVRQIGR